jgi:hypothetical protein
MLENLPDSFLSRLADIDPVVGMLSKKLRKSCGVACIDAWKFLTSVSIYNLVLSQTIDNFNIHKGIKCVACAKVASGDHMFVNSICEYDLDIWLEDIMYLAADWACKFDNLRILVPCMEAIRPEFTDSCFESRLIWGSANENGSTLVLDWFLVNRPEIIERVIPVLKGKHDKTVQWCIDHFMNSPEKEKINWLSMKKFAIMKNNQKSIMLLEWVPVPPCPFPGRCYNCLSCFISKHEN